MIGNIYRVTYANFQVSQITEMEKDCSVEKFRKKFENDRILERDKILAQTLLNDKELNSGIGIVFILMNPSYGCYISEEDVNLHEMKMRRKKQIRGRGY